MHKYLERSLVAWRPSQPMAVTMAVYVPCDVTVLDQARFQ
jgi:hypothetical protein